MDFITRVLAKPVLALVLIGALSGFGALEALFAPKPDLWTRWTTHDPQSRTTVDHGAWDAFLKRYVSTDAAGLNRVDYDGVTDADRAVLADYISKLGTVKVSSLTRPRQQAYWINLYNALAVKLVLDHKPENSIQDVDLASGLFSSGPWSAKLIEVEGEEISLNDIEHRILRPIWKDPRLHYAVNCASVSCPNLQREAFTAASMDAVLDAAARGYINTSRAVRVGTGGLVLSKIYAWFQDDFGGSEEGVLAHLRKFATGDLGQRLEPGTTIAGYEYDWRLNAARP